MLPKPEDWLPKRWLRQMNDLVQAKFAEFLQKPQNRKVDYPEMSGELLAAVDGEHRKVKDTVYVRPTYVISLSRADFEEISNGGFSEPLEKALREDVQSHITERGYTLNAPLNVRLRAEEQLELGYIGITASWMAYDPKRPDQRTVIRPPRGSVVATVIVLTGPQASIEYPLYVLPAVIGRDAPDSGADLRLRDPDMSLSRRHLKVEEEGGTLFVTDLGSHNGTWITGAVGRLTPNRRYPLAPGANVTLSDTLTIEIAMRNRAVSDFFDHD